MQLVISLASKYSQLRKVEAATAEEHVGGPRTADIDTVH